MATLLHRVRANMLWRIMAITPQCSRPGRGFIELARARAVESTGTTRGVSVYRRGRPTDLELTDMHARHAEHTYVVDVHYHGEHTEESIHEIVEQDAHDIIKALRDPAGWDGYSDTYSTADIGINNRYLVSEELIEDAVWILRMTFAVMVKEIENA